MIANPDQARVERESAAAVDRVQKDPRRLAALNRIQTGAACNLRRRWPEHGVMPDQVVLGNGSNELIELLVRSFLRPGDEAVGPTRRSSSTR